MIAGHGLWTKVVPGTRLPHIQKYPGFLFQCRIKSLQGRGGGRAESLDISLVEVLWWPLGWNFETVGISSSWNIHRMHPGMK